MNIATGQGPESRGPVRTIAALWLAVACWALLESRADAREPEAACRPSGTEAKAGDLRPRCVAPAPPGKARRPAPRGELRPAAAAPAPVPPPEPAEPLDHWYGWQTLIADAVSMGLLLGASAASASAAQSSDPNASESSAAGTLTTLGSVSYVVASPVVHGLHGRPAGRVVGSVALRVFVPLLGAIAGLSLSSCTSGGEGFAALDEAYCEASGAGLGLLVGMLVATGADAALSFEPSAAPPQAVRIYPSLRATGHSTELGVAGSF